MSQWLVSLAILGLLVEPQVRNFTDELWEENLDIYREILDHSFLTGLSEGTLSQEAFSFYMIQDAHYLREFARALSITASKAPREEWAALLNRHAVLKHRSYKTIWAHKHNAYKKMGIKNDADFINYLHILASAI